MTIAPWYLIEVLSECGCVVVDVLHHYGDVSFGVVLGVRCSDGHSVPGLLFKVQRGREGHPSAVAMDPKLAKGRRVELQCVGQGWAGVNIITGHQGDLCTNQCVWKREKIQKALVICLSGFTGFWYYSGMRT